MSTRCSKRCSEGPKRLHLDDASRFVTGYGVFESATTGNTLLVLEEAIRDQGRPAVIMTDHGSQFYSNEKEASKRGVGTFERRLAELGIMQVLAGVGHPQTNGKLERLHGEIQRKIGHFEGMMMRKSNPVDLFMRWYNHDRPHMSVDLFMRWYNHDRPHMSLDRSKRETSMQAFARKMPPEGVTVIDEQTGEEYHA